MSGMTEHPDRDLSAYLDEALAPAARAAVEAHLAGCHGCARRLAELQATARLVAALPAPVPGRSLVPRLAPRGPVWLRPVRSLSAVGSGLFLFLFLALSVIQSGSSLGGGTTASERLASRGQFGAAANAIASDAAAQKAATAASAAPAVDAARPAAAGPSAGTASAPGEGALPRAGVAPAAPAPRPFGPPAASLLGVALVLALVAGLAHRRLARR